MKQTAHLYDMTLRRLGEEVYGGLEAIYPEGKGPHVFGVKGIPLNDPRFAEVMTFLANNGHEPGGFARSANQFGFTIFRTYDADDFEACSFLVMLPSGTLNGSAERGSDGLLQINAPRKKICFGFPRNALFDVVVVSNGVKVLLEDAELKHLIFQPTRLNAKKGKAGGALDTLAPYWELTSSLTLPPMSPKMLLLNGTGEDFDGDYSKGCYLREGRYVPAASYHPVEVHYTASSLESSPPFDLAVSREETGTATPRMRQWVVSKRFYDFCCVHKLKMDWKPVRLDKG